MSDILTLLAGAQPDKPAVIDDRHGAEVRRLTYAELEERANRLAAVLRDLGVRAGTKVVWCGQNSVGVVEMVNAARKIGAVAVPLNYRLSDDEAAYVTDHSDTEVVYVDAEFAPLFERIRDRLGTVSTYLVYDLPPGSSCPEGMIDCEALMTRAPATPIAIDDPDEAGGTMIYTSGTTGRPKGAVRKAAGNPEQVQALLAHIGYTPDDVYLTTGPLYHSGPGGFMGLALAMGQTVVVQRKFDPEDWLRLLEIYRCTSTFAAPTPIRMVTNLPDEVKARYDRSSMRIMIANAAPWSFALKQRYVADFPQIGRAHV